MTEPILKVAGVSRKFGGVTALNDFSMSVAPGETVGLAGPNGAGKSTLFDLIAGAERCDAGEITFRGYTLGALPTHTIARLGIGRMFQQLRLARQLSVLDNLMLGMPENPGGRALWAALARHTWRVQERENSAAAARSLAAFGLGDLLNARAGELSFGQQKLISLVSCIVGGTQLLLLDEPVAGVAPALRERIAAVLQEAKQQGKTIVLIEHDFDFLVSTCERVVFMNAGRAVCEGPPQAIRLDPRVVEQYLGVT
jgi:ABC-type branched-subunit amino acid transport system ATPase component